MGPQFSHKGLAQGSPLSPLLFNIYTTELHKLTLKSIQLLQYANDLVIFIAHTEQEGRGSRYLTSVIQGNN